MTFVNVYEDKYRAESYSRLEYPGTYYLAFRDIKKIIENYLPLYDNLTALDFGCGAGRSTRHIKSLGFEIFGLDISQEMVNLAKQNDEDDKYFCCDISKTSPFPDNTFNLIFSAFTFDNISNDETKLQIFRKLRGLLTSRGIFVNLVSSPEIYCNEWASFTTKNFPENCTAKNGDSVKIVMKDVEDQRPVEDILVYEHHYKLLYEKCGLEVVNIYKPLGSKDDNIEWINEEIIAPWTIYVLRKK